jgi:hypothetical protein
MGDLQQARSVFDRTLAFVGVHATHFQPEADVSRDRHGRVQRVGLKHHRDIAVLGCKVHDRASADQDIAAGRLVEPGNHVEQGRLAASGRPEQNQEAPVLELDVDAVKNLYGAVGFAHILDGKCRHASTPNL